ncbi:MAG: amino acid adenylation domain-containing protein [Armatimonadetes bacterium]|nr:amino acid adenylation domain-containing protein [Armatimonadota bacterium]
MSDARSLPSPGQQRVWWLNQVDRGPGANELVCVLELTGPLGTPDLTAAFRHAIGRHEMLRAAFPAPGAEPVIEVRPLVDFQLPLIDLRGLPPETIRQRVYQLKLELALQPFELESPPLLRVGLARLEEDRHVLVLTVHSLICDEASLMLMLTEIATAYRAFQAGSSPRLPSLPLQFPAYCTQQREWLRNSPEAHRQREFWRGELEGAPRVLDLPLDVPRPAIQTACRELQQFELPPVLLQGAQKVAARLKTGPEVLFLAAFAALLFRLTSQTDLVVGFPAAARDRPDAQFVLGPFGSRLPVRIRLVPTEPLKNLVESVREALERSRRHGRLPLEHLVESLGVDQSLAYRPLFQVQFMYCDPPFLRRAAGLAMGPVSVEPLEFFRSTTDCDLTLAIEPDIVAGKLSFSVDYNADLFAEGTLARLASRFRSVLEQLLFRPDISPADLQAPDASGAAGASAPIRLFLDRFDEQVTRRPQAVAVESDRESVTYSELCTRAQAVVRALLSDGVGPEEPVALAADRCADYVAAVIGILRAGAAYLPLDRRHPEARRADLARRAGARRLLGDRELAELASRSSRDVAELPGARAVLRRPILPQSLAFLLFTSGSTGEPKSVMVSHQGLANHLEAKIGDLRMTDSDAVAQTAPPSFVISVWQMLAPLAVGGRVRILPDEVAIKPHEVMQRDVSIVQLVPSVLRLLLDEPFHALEGRSIRWMVATGEALPRELIARWIERYPGIPLMNAYGATETSDDVAHCLLPEAGSGPGTPIGKPVQNVSMYAVDPWTNRVPVGAVGELVAGGSAVARGYLCDPRATAEKFVPDPYSEEPGARLYRTGDLVRQREDGSFDYVGRRDHQVKIGGIRVEPQEAAAALLQHPAVRQAAVVEVAGRLAAYVVAGVDIRDELEAYLRSRLPDYLVPDTFTCLEELPLNLNGKLDRAALPAPRRLRVAAGRPPGPGVEQRLAALWEELLGLAPVAADNDFFELGGHSLLALRMLRALEREFGTRLELSDLTGCATVERLARRLAELPSAARD